MGWVRVQVRARARARARTRARVTGDMGRYVEIQARSRGGIADHIDAGLARAAVYCLAALTGATWLGVARATRVG